MELQNAPESASAMSKLQEMVSVWDRQAAVYQRYARPQKGVMVRFRSYMVRYQMICKVPMKQTKQYAAESDVGCLSFVDCSNEIVALLAGAKGSEGARRGLAENQ